MLKRLCLKKEFWCTLLLTRTIWKQSCIHTMDFSSSLALALNKSHQPRNSCWRVWPDARGEATAPSLFLPGPRLAHHPTRLDTEHEEHRSYTRKHNHQRSQEQGLGTTKPAVRNCCFSPGTQTPASKLRPETAQRAMGLDALLTTPASVRRATAAPHKGPGTKGSSSRRGQGQSSGARTNDTRHRRRELGRVRDRLSTGGAVRKRHRKSSHCVNDLSRLGKGGGGARCGTDFIRKVLVATTFFPLCNLGLPSCSTVSEKV